MHPWTNRYEYELFYLEILFKVFSILAYRVSRTLLVSFYYIESFILDQLNLRLIQLRTHFYRWIDVLQFFYLLFQHIKHTKEKTKKKITQIIIIWQNMITISPFFKAQRCAHYHLGWRSQIRSYHPQCWMLIALQVHSLHLFFAHHFSSNLVHNPNNIHQFQPFKTCLTSIQSSSYHFVVCIW